MRNNHKKWLTIIVAALTILTISGSVFASSFTESYSFKFHNHNPAIGNSGANTDLNNVEGLYCTRTYTVKVDIEQSNGTYKSNSKSISTTNMTDIGLTVGKTSDSWSAVPSKHKVTVNDGELVGTAWVDYLLDQDYSGSSSM